MSITNRKIIVLLAAVILLAAAAGGILWMNRPKGPEVVVTVINQEYGRYNLHKDQTVVIGPEDGSWHNTLVIKNGMAEIVESDCDNQVCVYTPALREDMVGIIVCLPHSLIVELK